MRRLGTAVLLLSLLPLAACRPRAHPDLLHEDAWFSLEMRGAHVGWMHLVREPGERDGRSVVTTSQEVFMRIHRYGTEMEVRSSQRSVESPEGRPISLEVVTEMSREKTVTRGTFRGDRLVLETQTPGGTSRSELPWPEDGVLALGADLLLLRETELQAGRRVSYSTFSPDLGSVVRETVEVEAGRPAGLLALRSTQDELPGQHTITRVEPGSWAIQEIEIPSLGMRLRRTTRRAARDLPEDLPDIGFDTMIAVDTEVDDPLSVDRAVYRLRAGEGATLEGLDLEDGRRQRLLDPAPDGWLRLEVRRTGGPAGGEEEPDSRYLASSSYLQTGSADLQEALAQALGPEGAEGLERREVARRLALWVRDEVDERAQDIGFATAAEVARDRRGDCSEHAVLLAGLLRAAGIPSRVRAGLLYLPDGGDGRPAFGFHLWTQAWLEGWLDLDATLGGEEADALHLGLATTDLNDPGGVGPLSVMAPLLGSLDLELEAVE